MMTQTEMMTLVPKKLHDIEKEYNVKILWAVESGSRAWGFASPDSDFDVRFIYKRSPQDYLKLNKQRDVIEIPIDDTWDVNGWDLDKTLSLLQKGNPTLFEWLNSPIKYIESDFAEKMKPLMDEAFSEGKMLYHYLNTAKNTLKTQLQGEMVKPKKYFYVLRPLLACRWVIQKHDAPPVLFEDLAKATLPASLKCVVDDLLEIKMNSAEKEVIKPVEELHEFFDSEIARTEALLAGMKGIKGCAWDNLNEFFWEEINR